MKKALTIILALVLAVAVGCAAVSIGQVAKIKQTCTWTVFSALRELDTQLTHIAASGAYTMQDCEAMQVAWAKLDTAARAAEGLYAYPISFEAFFTSIDVADALGCGKSFWQSGKDVESILYDGAVSARELAFIAELQADVHALLAPMLAEDGLNRRPGLSWNDIRPGLRDFYARWGQWNWTISPYDLLVVEA